MALILECGLCSYRYDEEQEGTPWEELPADWTCPVCGSSKAEFAVVSGGEPPAVEEKGVPPTPGEYLGEWRRTADDVEPTMADIHAMAATGVSIVEPMRTTAKPLGWEEVIIIDDENRSPFCAGDMIGDGNHAGNQFPVVPDRTDSLNDFHHFAQQTTVFQLPANCIIEILGNQILIYGAQHFYS